MKYEHFKKYLLYKYYAEFISIKFISKPIDNMSNKQLHNYLVKLKILYNYSEKCYILREEYTKQCIDEDKRDIGHEIAISITKQYNHDVLLFINKILLIIENTRNKTFLQNKFGILTNENIDEIIDNDENIDENIDDIKNEDEIEFCKVKSLGEIKESDDEILDKIILEKQKMIDDIYNILENRFEDYNIKYTMTLMYMSLQFLSLSNFNMVFNILDNDKKKLLYNIILNIDKFDFVKMVVCVNKSYIFNNNKNDNIDNIIHCDVKLKGESRINPVFFDKYVKIDILVRLFYIQMVSCRIRDTDIEMFNKIIDGRVPKLSKSIKSRNNALDSSKYAYELINDNDTLYLYMDY